MRLTKAAAALAALTLTLSACDGRDAAGPPVGALSPTFQIFTNPVVPGGNLYPEAVFVCKEVPTADAFDFTATSTRTDLKTFVPAFSLTNHQCRMVAQAGGALFQVTVSETAEPGFQLDSIVRYNAVFSSGTLVNGAFQITSVDTLVLTSGNSATAEASGSASGALRGGLILFYNSPIPTYSIGDFVWSDLNGNGVQDAGEPGLANIPVALGGDATANTTTDANGYYLFSGLVAGDYTVTVGTPAGYNPSPSNQGGDPTKDSNGSPASVTITNADDLTIDFGFVYIPPTTVTLCKVGSAADFTVSVDGTPTDYSLGNGACQIVNSHAGGTADQTVVLTEHIPTGYTLDSIVVLGGPKYTGVNSATVTSGDAGNVTVTFYNSRITIMQGCTPGYWKQRQHFDSWTAPYTPQTLFSDVFANAFPGKTLLQVLGQGGGGLNALGRHTVAALLNAASAGVTYNYQTPADVINAFNAAFTSGNYETQKNLFEGYNEQGCPLN